MELEYLLALHAVNDMAPRRMQALLQHYGSAETAWHARKEWARAGFVAPSAEAELLAAAAKIEPEQAYEAFLRSGAELLQLSDENYPALLKTISAPPPLLFYLGDLTVLDRFSVAIIGSRRATPYGEQAAELLAGDLAQRGALIVSGMARGIDSAGHRAALARGGKTAAVLGCGIDLVYPPENRGLKEEIAANGVVFSEFPPGTLPAARNFPMRNRLISGLSHAVVVVEAGEKSGTLHTVDYALEQGRDVFAVPGPISSPMSRGTHELLRQGALLAASAEDIYRVSYRSYAPEPVPRQTTLADFAAPAKPDRENAEQKDQTEERLLQLLTLPRHFDELQNALALPAQELAARLTIWELEGKIRSLPGQRYIAENTALMR